MGTHTHTIQTKLEGKHGPTDCIYCWWRISQTSEAFSSSAVRVCLAVWNIEVSKVLGVPEIIHVSRPWLSTEIQGDLGIIHFKRNPHIFVGSDLGWLCMIYPTPGSYFFWSLLKAEVFPSPLISTAPRKDIWDHRMGLFFMFLWNVISLFLTRLVTSVPLSSLREYISFRNLVWSSGPTDVLEVLEVRFLGDFE